MSPLYTSKALRRTIDLSQLSEVGEASYVAADVVCDYDDDYAEAQASHMVFFEYRIGSSQAIRYERSLRVGPNRTYKGELENPADTLLQVGEEMYLKNPPANRIEQPRQVLIEANDSGELVAVVNLRRDVDALIKAWSEWKVYDQSCRNRSNQ